MYYPKSQIKTNLYTNGGELVFINRQDVYYTGYYYETSTGKKFTGKTPNSKGRVELIPVSSPSYKIPNDDIAIDPVPVETVLYATGPDADPDKTLSQDPSEFNYKLISEYFDLTNNLSTNNVERNIPPISQTTPTPEEYEAGETQRYFVKKNTEYTYFETDKQTYDKYINDDPTIASDLYTIISVPWRIINSPINEKMAAQVERNNNWFGFKQWVRNSGGGNNFLYTKGGEYLLPNRTNYIGFYHVMENGIVMTGKSHGKGMNVKLIPLNRSTSDSPGVAPEQSQNNYTLNLSLPSSAPATPSAPTEGSLGSSGGGSSGGGGGGY